jgi:hypothetical protein
MEMVRHEIHGCPSLFAHWKQEHKVPQSTPKSPLIHISRQPCEQPGVSVNPTARCSGAKGPQDPGWDGWKQRQQGEQEGQQEQAWFEFFWSEFMQTTSYKVQSTDTDCPWYQTVEKGYQQLAEKGCIERPVWRDAMMAMHPDRAPPDTLEKCLEASTLIRQHIQPRKCDDEIHRAYT